ncbi:hypothetical protein [Streptomyces europaeiscabiei]|uniref:hypothetical protein n=1 Tax=Streptomyces europaeiscabiei TaxID=146819 RepID=UPI0038F708C8
MTILHSLPLAIGTSATAAIGTWVIGVIGGTIAYQQLLNNSFRPAAKSYREEGWDDPEKDRMVIVVRIHNRGGADGMIERIDVTGPGHEYIRKVNFRDWEGDRPPVPFILPGHASAVLVLTPDDDMQFSTGERVLLTFNLGKPLCVNMQVKRQNFETVKNLLPPGSAPVTGKPAEE